MNTQEHPMGTTTSTHRRFAVLVTAALLPTLLGPVAPSAADDADRADRAAAPTCFGQRATIVASARGGVLEGTVEDDVIVGSSRRDVINTRGGNDRVCALGGSDEIKNHEFGWIDGGSGNDVLRGGDQHDTLRGGRDRDRIYAGGGNDVAVDGGPGKDFIDGGTGVNRLDGGSGDDDIYSGPDGGPDALVDGQEGEDLLFAQAGGMTVLGGPDDDTIQLGGGADSFARGEDGDDTITGSRFSDIIDGGEDTDTIKAGSGNDTAVTGGAGRDKLFGGDGDDRLQGGPDPDVCDGGADDDTCDGGSPGLRGNTPTDADRCTAEELISCRGQATLSYTGHASGEMTYGGITETWTATFRTDQLGDSTTTQGPASVTWTISGTGIDSGCTYEGSDSYEGLVSISLFEPLDRYGIQLRSLHSADIEVDCPLTPPETEEWWALNGGVGDEWSNLPDDPTVLIGSEDYAVPNNPGVHHTWQWSARTAG